jgi:hypothetical protein
MDGRIRDNASPFGRLRMMSLLWLANACAFVVQIDPLDQFAAFGGHSSPLPSHRFAMLAGTDRWG